MPKIRVPRHDPPQPDDLFYRYIPLTQGQNAIVDTADYEWLMQFNWQALWDPKTKTYYAVRKQRPTMVKMHRQIMDAQTGEEVDHANGDTLDNRRHNLRKCTTAQNAWNKKRSSLNTTGYKGVYWRKNKNHWQVNIKVRGKKIYLGSYRDIREAAKAYDRAAKEHFGPFARLNIPD